MRLTLTTSLTRKLLALLIVVIASALGPATAVIGFCAKLPCCAGEAKSVPAAVAPAGCCSTISCYEAPPQNLTVGTKAKVFPPATLAVLRVALPTPQVFPALLTFDDTSPPSTTSDRLSTLSFFLI